MPWGKYELNLSESTLLSLIALSAERTPSVSVSFFGLDHTRQEVTPYGHCYPARIYLSDDSEGDLNDPRSMNLANDNARAFLGLLGLGTDCDLYGEVPLPEARRAIIRARATFHCRVGAFLREEAVVFGRPRVHDDGTVELRPVRVWIGGVDEDYLARQLDRLAVLVEALAERGATHLGWG